MTDNKRAMYEAMRATRAKTKFMPNEQQKALIEKYTTAIDRMDITEDGLTKQEIREMLPDDCDPCNYKDGVEYNHIWHYCLDKEPERFGLRKEVGTYSAFYIDLTNYKAGIVTSKAREIRKRLEGIKNELARYGKNISIYKLIPNKEDVAKIEKLFEEMQFQDVKIVRSSSQTNPKRFKLAYYAKPTLEALGIPFQYEKFETKFYKI